MTKQKGFLHDFSEPATPAIELAEAGRLSVGMKHPEKNYPMQLDYFRVYNADRAAEAAFKKVYGDKPKELAVTFLSSNPMEVCKTQYVIRCGKNAYAKGDGKVFTYWHVFDWSKPGGKGENRVKEVHSEAERDQFMAEIKEQADKVASVKGVSATGWQIRLTLTVWLPEVNVPGVWVFSTGGAATSVKKISGVFRTVLLAAKTVQFLPFKLRVRMYTADSMEAKSYPIVELLPPSSQVMAAASDYGKILFDSLFGAGGMRMLKEAEIMEAAKELEAKTGEAYNAAPVTDQPKEITEKLAKTYFDNVEEESENPETKPEPGTAQANLQAIKKAESYQELVKIWEKVPTPQRQESMRWHYAIKSAELATMVSTLNKLVRENKEFHGDEQFKRAVQEARLALASQS